MITHAALTNGLLVVQKSPGCGKTAPSQKIVILLYLVLSIYGFGARSCHNLKESLYWNTSDQLEILPLIAYEELRLK